MGDSIWIGLLQPSCIFSIFQISILSLCGSPSLMGRFEMKYRVPSLVINGSASQYWPENGAISGSVHLPSLKCETKIVHLVKSGAIFTKSRVLPSGEKAGWLS